MIKKGTLIFFIFAVLMATATIGAAQPPGIPIYGPGGIPNVPGGFQGGLPNSPIGNQWVGPNIPASLPETIPTIIPPEIGAINQSSQRPELLQNGHPATGPDAMQPTEAPQASTGKVVMNLGDKQALSSQEIITNFGSEPQSNSATRDTSSAAHGWLALQTIPTGIQYYAFNNGIWTQQPSAVFFNQRMNLLLSNDRAQNIWAYELYPNRWPNWSYWGYRWAGSYNAIFVGDMRGWHLCAIYGDESGWSNVLWIYVW
jgi:hypothetical protein